MSWNVPFVIVAVKEKSEAHYQVETGLQYGTVQPIWPDHNNNIIIMAENLQKLRMLYFPNSTEKK